MDALTYPVIFEKDEDGYLVTVPDLDRMTQGTDLTNAIANARDAICLTIVDLEDDGKPVPPPSHSVKTPDNGFISYVDANIAEYRKNRFYNKCRDLVDLYSQDPLFCIK